MTLYVSSPNDTDVMSALQSWVMLVTGLPLAAVIPAYDNFVAPPLDPFIVLSRVSRTPNSTPWLTYNDTGVQTTENEITNLSIDYKYQIDCYGSAAADLVMIMHVLLRSDATSEWFSNYGLTNGLTVDTFYADDPTHTAITNEENQYEERWTLRVRLNVVVQIATPVNFMSSAKVGLTNASTLPR